MSPINILELVDFFGVVLTWIYNFFDVLRQPLNSWVQLDLPGDNVITVAIEEIVNWLLDVFLGAFGDFTILEFCFGSGLTFLLVILLARLFVSFRK